MTRFSLACLIFALVLWGWLVPAMLSYFVPPSLFLVVEKVEVSDAIEGEPIPLDASWTVVRPHESTLRLEVRRQVNRGWAHVCVRHMQNVPYRLDSAVPENLDLNWWLGIPPNIPCKLPPGTYDVVTDHTIPFWLGSRLRITTTSNTFRILDAGR